MHSTPIWQRGALLEPTLSFSSKWVDQTPQALIDLKERIEPLEASGQWELLKKMVNPYEIVYTHEHPAFHPSLAVIKPLSRSYFKMLEMLDVLGFYDRIPKKIQKIRTAHIAEGPGGFIQAIVDTMDRHSKLHAVATAMTLKPVDSRVPGWRRATAFLQRHRHVKLHYGADGTGDIYVPENQATFLQAVSPGVALFTADGGFDFSVNYQIQEQRVFHLLACSALTAVQSLSIDGSLVLKVFDTYSPATKALLAILSRSFKEWCIYKPCLSRPCNSERYFLGRGFRGCTAERLRPLKELFAASAEGRFPELILTEDESAYIAAQDTASTELQMKALTQALVYASQPDAWYTNQLPKDFATSLAWCHKYRVPTQRAVPISLTYQKDAVPQS